VAYEVVLDLAVAEAPHLHELVPSAGHDDGGLCVGAEADAAYPLGVASLFKGVLAFTEDVPQLDGLVAGARDNLTIVRGERNTEHILKSFQKEFKQEETRSNTLVWPTKRRVVAPVLISHKRSMPSAENLAR
jgi:hypothetical protein